MEFNRNSFDNQILHNQIIGPFEQLRELNSKRLSNFYVNWRKILLDKTLTDSTVKFSLNFIKDLGIEPKTICGVPAGMTPFGILLQHKFVSTKPKKEQSSYPIVAVREKSKSHGDPADANFVGRPKEPILLFEDVSTTLLSVLKTINFFKKSGFQVEWVISLTNRLEKTPIPGVDNPETVEKYSAEYKLATGKEYLQSSSALQVAADAGSKYFSMTDVSTLLPKMLRLSKLNEEFTTRLKEERSKFGIETTPFVNVKRKEQKIKTK